MADDCAEIFYRLNIIFRSGLAVRVPDTYTRISVSFTYINSTFPYFIFSIFFAPHSVAPAARPGLFTNASMTTRSPVAPSHLKVVTLDVVIIASENWSSRVKIYPATKLRPWRLFFFFTSPPHPPRSIFLQRYSFARREKVIRKDTNC